MPFKPGINSIGLLLAVVLILVGVVQYAGFFPHRWQTYSSPAGDFSIEFPGKATADTRQVPREGGGMVLLHSVHVQALGNRYFSCSYVEADTGRLKTPDQVLEAGRDGGIHRVQATIVEQHRLTVQGFPALQYQARTTKNLVMDTRLILVDRRLYSLIAVAPSASNDEVRTVQHMFDSFRAVQK